MLFCNIVLFIDKLVSDKTLIFYNWLLGELLFQIGLTTRNISSLMDVDWVAHHILIIGQPLLHGYVLPINVCLLEVTSF